MLERMPNLLDGLHLPMHQNRHDLHGNTAPNRHCLLDQHSQTALLSLSATHCVLALFLYVESALSLDEL